MDFDPLARAEEIMQAIRDGGINHAETTEGLAREELRDLLLLSIATSLERIADDLESDA